MIKKRIKNAQFGDIDQARIDIFEDIETYYNTKRIHSNLGTNLLATLKEYI